MAKPKTLTLIDGTAQIFRAYFAIRGLTGPNGQPTNALYGFTTMLRKMLKDGNPTEVAVAFDLPGPTFRHERFPQYKANRPPAPEDLIVQIPRVGEICEALGVQLLQLEGYEADDIIATLARQGTAEGRRVVIVSSDKDLMQLVNDDVTMFDPGKDRRLDPAGVTNAFGVPPDQVLEVLALMGDSVDNIPGVPGVGEKTALEMIRTHGSLESVIERADRFSGLMAGRDAVLTDIDALSGTEPLQPETVAALLEHREGFARVVETFVNDEPEGELRERVEALAAAVAAVDGIALKNQEGLPAKGAAKLVKGLKAKLKGLERGTGKRSWISVAEHADQARLSKELATLCYEVPIPMELEELAVRPPDRALAHRLFKSFGFRRLTEEFAGDAPETPDVPGVAGESAPVSEAPGGRYAMISTAKELADVVKAARAAGRFAIDTETDGLDPMQARLVGISMSWEAGSGCYIPLGHDYEGCPTQLELGDVVSSLGPLLMDATVGKLGQNLKYDAHILRRHGLPVVGWALDTMVAAFLLDSSKPSYGMDRLALEFLGHETIKYESLTGKGAKKKTLNQVEVAQVTGYAGEDADVTWQLAQTLQPLLEERGLWELYEKLDGPLLPLLERMEAQGIRLDADVLAAMSVTMESSLTRLRGEIHELAGGEFNLDSPKQMREILFDRLGLKAGRKTAKGGVASTDAQTLEGLFDQHPIAGKILEYREQSKLKNTYVDALPRLLHPETGRIHTSYHPTGAATGRLSSSDPNLQNIPARTEAGREIRAAFVADPGHTFLASDYSQIELRVLAHLCEDPELIRAFNAGEDIHRYTASRVFDVPDDQVTSQMRGKAKAVNFGILYGMSETRLAREQGMKRDEARAFIAAYFERFDRIRGYIDGVREQALKDAAVKTMFGRIRFFPQLHQKVHRGIQEQALRAAVNTTIQGTAADLMKQAMLDVDRALRKDGTDARMLLQVHDELLLEVADGDLDRVAAIVRDAMEGVASLQVPLVVDQKRGPNWRDLS
ncbi:MAG: DNA polymerase I [Acidobacteriota bacterium]|nr:DNA polymerase I [Acidobacteriota bacterium]MDH3785338.1 DNA polymerase I [Acidobacteriota bacterium]